MVEACWAQEQEKRPEFKEISRLLSCTTILWLEPPEREPEVEAELTYDGFLTALNLLDMKEALAEYLEEGKELRDLKQMDEDDLNEDILDDDDLQMDEATKERFREAVTRLSGT